MSAERSRQARALAKLRVEWQRENDRAELAKLRAAIALATRRRRQALAGAALTCRKARRAMSERARVLRAEAVSRINREAAELRNRARAQCQARRYRIEASGRNAAVKAREEAQALARLQLQIARASNRADRLKRKSTAKERAEEDDDAVRGNLPAELLPVFERVKRQIKGAKRTTRTEAFLEWAESHPEDVLAYQGDETEREVVRLVAEHDAAERKLRKTRPRSIKRASGDDVPF